MSANFSNGALPPHATRSKELLVLVTFPFRAGRENFFRPGGGAKTAFAPDLARITKEKNDKAVISEMCRSRSLCVQLSTTCVFQGLVRSILRGAGTGHHENPVWLDCWSSVQSVGAADSILRSSRHWTRANTSGVIGLLSPLLRCAWDGGDLRIPGGRQLLQATSTHISPHRPRHAARTRSLFPLHRSPQRLAC
jgi:hypothetical protein